MTKFELENLLRFCTSSVLVFLITCFDVMLFKEESKNQE